MNLLAFHPGQESTFFVVESGPGPKGTDPSSDPSLWQNVRAQILEWYHRLQERLDHGERVCSNLRHAERLTVVRSPNTEQEPVRTALKRFLEGNARKHTRWMWIDGILASLGALLTPIPGPNVFFFYPAARALAHYWAREGAVRALRLEWTDREEELIDIVESQLQNLGNVSGPIQALEQRYNLGSLSDQLGHLKDV